MQSDIAIIGGGLAGSTLAAMLGRAGIRSVLIDPHAEYPADFRCEKFDSSQIGVLEKTGLLNEFRIATAQPSHTDVARYGRVLDRKPNPQLCFAYETAVNTMRRLVPPSVPILTTKATAIENSDDRQRITLANGAEVSARLAVVSNGLNVGLRHGLGIEREILSACHSISIGFDVRPETGSFDFSALTYFPERAEDRAAYITFFPIGRTMRVNLFVYRQMDDPWLRQMRREPVATLFALMPGLRQLTGEIAIVGAVKIRPVDLYVATNHLQPGIVLAGDAYSTSCPAAGTGANKALTDVELLANTHIPQMLATPGMGREKIAAFYADPTKEACETYSREKAFNLKSISTEPGPAWLARRLARFGAHWTLGQVRAGKEWMTRRRASAPELAERNPAPR